MYKFKWLPVALLVGSSLHLSFLANHKFSIFILVIDLLWILDWYFKEIKFEIKKIEIDLQRILYPVILIGALYVCLIHWGDLSFSKISPKNLFMIMPILFLASFRKRRRKIGS
ncbi:MAG: hypothetical protein VX642_02880 [Bdellovibrionota bacterium]|nr:hypothetical protein [Bdellovibrionota bacterium]